MDPYTPKTFAVGEILTAQDVNTHLVNNIRRTVYTGAAAATGSDGVTFTDAQAIMDEDAQGNRTITLRIRHSGLDASQGNQFTPIGVLAEALRPPWEVPVPGTRGSSAQMYTINWNGLIHLRNSTANLTGAVGQLTATYLVLGDE